MFKKVYVLRVKPGHELIGEIKTYCQQKVISSGTIIDIIGSVKSASIGIPFEPSPGKYEYERKDYNQLFSIVSGQGTISLMNNDLVLHIHVMLSGHDINVGGHIFRANIWATAEVAIGELDYQLRHDFDPQIKINVLQQQ